MSRVERLRVANTILTQLGGPRFFIMTGAAHPIAIENGVMFTLPARLARQGINRVRIELNASDTYTMTTLKVNARQDESIEIQCESLIYCDQLEAVFEDMTGVYTRF